MSAVSIVASYSPTPEDLAAAFWNMDTTQQVAFFGHLHKLAGVSLCFQMAGVVQEIERLGAADDYHALNGFQTMLSHAQAYGESATDIRTWAAQRDLREAAASAKARFAP